MQRGWLTSKGLIESDYEKNRDYLAEQMKKYYFDPSDKVYNAWSDSELKSWLADHDVIKPEAQVKREKLIKIMSCVFSPSHVRTLSHPSIATTTAAQETPSGVLGLTLKSALG